MTMHVSGESQYDDSQHNDKTKTYGTHGSVGLQYFQPEECYTAAVMI